MNINYYSIYDRISETYGNLFTLANDNVAKRSFKEACKINKELKMHPTDLELHKIAIFNTETGQIQEERELIMRGEKNNEAEI